MNFFDPFAMTQLGAPLPAQGRSNRKLAEDVAKRFPPDVPLDLSGVIELLGLVRPMRTPFPMFTLRSRVQPGRCYSTGALTSFAHFNVELYADVIVYDREDPSRALPLTFSNGDVIPQEMATPRRLLEFVRAFILRIYQHELDEHFFVGDARVFDPHDEQLVKQGSNFGSFR